MTLRSIVFFSAILVGCGASTSAETTTDAAPDGTPDGSKSDTGVAETAFDAACPACLSSTISWGYDGGEVAWVDRSNLTGCADYARTRTKPGMTTPDLACEAKIPTCPGDVPDADFVTGVLDVEAALANADVKDALGKAPVLYGSDPRAFDGAVFQIVVGGKKIELGGACSGASGCTEVPAGLAALRTVLERIDSEKTLTACSAFKP